jgi:hypothetical protein
MKIVEFYEENGPNRNQIRSRTKMDRLRNTVINYICIDNVYVRILLNYPLITGMRDVSKHKSAGPSRTKRSRSGREAGSNPAYMAARQQFAQCPNPESLKPRVTLGFYIV